MADPAAAKAMAELRTEHRAGMQAWFDKYGQRPTSAEARRALQKLRADHWRDMKAVFGELGIERPRAAAPAGPAALAAAAQAAVPAAQPALRVQATA